ncbi:AAA family ATPase [Rhizobium mongolense]|uniref:DNA polymerase III delta prime subunit n=1 Tax=Rhizobium mongolense TaxID=57676 RepID=A0A7W6WDY9_9HYPH|nr:AAA family ATPase [Rhizobium mongolense]MBB4274114.1 DNA polymerase III delta prime subunit [Rhizobium mongolense]
MHRRLTAESGTSPLLSRTACMLALLKSLQDFAPVYRDEPFTLVLTIPEASRKDLVRAFYDLKKTEPIFANVELGVMAVGARGRADYGDIQASLRLAERVLIFLDSEVEAPAFVIAAADTIAAIHPINGQILADAVKIAHGANLDIADANRILGYPIMDVFAALRPGRSHAEALSRLEAARASALDHETLPVEKLSGYGEAADWARSVVEDMAAWRAGRIPWGDVDAAALLSGPSGVGKTLFARSLARSCECFFVASSLAQWQAAGHLGDMLKAMRETFRMAAERAPTVLLLDEFDSVGDRTKFAGHNAQYSTEVVAALLECLDGAYRREGVIVVGACNHPDRIDKALLRPGRLGRQFALSLPDTEARRGILLTHLGEALCIEDVARVAAATIGLSGADLGQLARDGRRVARKKSRPITVDDVLSCLPPVAPITGPLRDRICIHEAGHAAAVLALNVGKLSGVVVMDGFRNGVGIGGGVHFERESQLPTTEYYLNSIVVQLAGMAAEVVLFGDHLEGSGGQPGSDLQRAADVATSMVAQLGMGGITNFLSADSFEDLERIRRTVPAVNQRVERMLAEQYERAKELVIKNEAFICELAVILNWEGAVDGKRATALFDAMEAPDAP